MEQARCWMLTERKHGFSSPLQLQAPSYDDSSWEEQAFAEDAAGPLGGCIWPPRSYSCSFCRREFRSAQALGGHMNVHRRDRARLKQSPNSQNEILPHHHQNHHQLQSPYNTSSLGFQCPPHQIATLVYSNSSPPNPNSEPFLASSSSRVPAATPTGENYSEKSFFPPFTSSSSSVRNEKLGGEKCNYHETDLWRSEEGEKKNTSKVLESGLCLAENKKVTDYVKTDLSMSLNLVLRRSCPITLSDDDEDEKEAKRRKRRRTETTPSSSPSPPSPSPSPLPFFLQAKKSADKTSPCSIGDLDLELRLGDRPKVK